jgi:hypothetical protein
VSKCRFQSSVDGKANRPAETVDAMHEDPRNVLPETEHKQFHFSVDTDMGTRAEQVPTGGLKIEEFKRKV